MKALRQENQGYTYADFITWDEDVRYELIDGEAYLLAAPNVAHQRISGELHGQIWQFLKGKPCEVFHAALDVRLNADEDDNTVLEPDIVVVCDRSKLAGGKACVGAPDMVAEILSPSTAGRDCILKLEKYQKAGVREYWIVDPESRSVGVHVWDNGKTVFHAYEETDTVPVHVLEGCAISLPDVFGPLKIED